VLYGAEEQGRKEITTSNNSSGCVTPVGEKGEDLDLSNHGKARMCSEHKRAGGTSGSRHQQQF